MLHSLSSKTLISTKLLRELLCANSEIRDKLVSGITHLTPLLMEVPTDYSSTNKSMTNSPNSSKSESQNSNSASVSTPKQPKVLSSTPQQSRKSSNMLTTQNPRAHKSSSEEKPLNI